MAIILVVDDYVIDWELLVTLLGYYGHRMLEAGDGTEALEVAWVERSNLIISDILMPTTDGYEYVRQLRAAQHRQYRYHFLYSYLAPTRRASHSSGVRCVASSGQNLAIRLILCGQSR